MSSNPHSFVLVRRGENNPDARAKRLCDIKCPWKLAHDARGRLQSSDGLTSLGNLNILEAADFPYPKKALLRRLFFTSRPVAASLARAYPKQNVEDYSRSWP